MSARAITHQRPGPIAVPMHHHYYHGEAHVFGGRLEHPIQQPLENFGKVVMQNTRRETHIARSVGETSIEGLISFKRGYTRVIGTQVKHKTDGFGRTHDGWITLSTAVLEGLNVVDILTADRVVAQVSTEHAVNGKGEPEDVPTVTFLGTRFENLQIGGYPVKVTLNLDFCGNKPEGNHRYLRDIGFLNSVGAQCNSVAEMEGLPPDLAKQYHAKIATIKNLEKRANGGPHGNKRKEPSKVECTLVSNIEFPVSITGVKTFGNVIFIPNFGTVALAELEVGVNRNHTGSGKAQNGSQPGPTGNYFTLNMFSMKLGCPTAGATSGPSVTANGHGSTGGGPG
jgi:hypothetical protein